MFVAFVSAAWVGTGVDCILTVLTIISNPLVANLTWSPFWSAFTSVFYAEPLLCVFFIVAALYCMGLTSLFVVQFGNVLAGITTNEIENRHRLNYVVFPGRTVWSSNSQWRNFASFFRLSSKLPKYDWKNVYELPGHEEPRGEEMV